MRKPLRTQITGGLVGIIMAIAFAALAFVVAGLVLSYGALINTNVGAGFNTNASVGNTLAAQVNGNVSTGLQTFGSNMPTVAQVAVAVLIISLLFLGFGSLITRGGQGGSV